MLDTESKMSTLRRREQLLKIYYRKFLDEKAHWPTRRLVEKEMIIVDVKKDHISKRWCNINPESFFTDCFSVGQATRVWKSTRLFRWYIFENRNGQQTGSGSGNDKSIRK